MRLVLSCLAVSLLVGAPADAAAQRAKKCTPESPDSSLTSIGAVYRDCDVSKRATVKSEPRLDPNFDGSALCLLAEIEFVVDTTGTVHPDLPIVAIESNNAAFLRQLTNHVREMRWRPALKDGVPVRQVVRLRKGFERRRSFTVAVVEMGSSPPPPPATIRGANPPVSRCGV